MINPLPHFDKDFILECESEIFDANSNEIMDALTAPLRRPYLNADLMTLTYTTNIRDSGTFGRAYAEAGIHIINPTRPIDRSISVTRNI